MNISQALFRLVRQSVGYIAHDTSDINFTPIQWESILSLADQQGLSAIIFDGIKQIPEQSRPPQKLLLQWIGIVVHEEEKSAIQWNLSCKLALLLKKNQIKTYVLKGDVIAECYPRPLHRKCVDFDCYLISENEVEDVWEKGNRIVENAGVKVDRYYYKNSRFFLPGLIVENHRYLTPFRGNENLMDLERMFQRLLHEDNGYDKFDGTELYKPPVMVSALFLVEHAYSHFLHEGLTWRHVLDWMLFSRKHKMEINWKQFDLWIDKYGFRKFYGSYVRLGQLLLGEFDESRLSRLDKMMLEDVWAPLDIHDTLNGVRGKMNLVGNTWRARWKYREFTEMSWMMALWIQVKGFLFIKNPVI